MSYNRGMVATGNVRNSIRQTLRVKSAMTPVSQSFLDSLTTAMVVRVPTSSILRCNGEMKALTGKFSTMLTIIMRHVSSISWMTTMREDFLMETAFLGGVANGSSAHLKIKTVAAMSAGRKTVSKTVALARRFARSGMPVSMITTGTRGAGKLKIAMRAWLKKYQLMLRTTLGTLSTW